MQFQTLHQTVQYFAKKCKNLKYLKTLWTRNCSLFKPRGFFPPLLPAIRDCCPSTVGSEKEKKDQLLDLKNQMFKNKNVQKTGEGKNLLWRIGMCGWQRREAAKKIVSEHQIFEISTVNLWFLWGGAKTWTNQTFFLQKSMDVWMTKTSGCKELLLNLKYLYELRWLNINGILGELSVSKSWKSIGVQYFPKQIASFSRRLLQKLPSVAPNIPGSQMVAAQCWEMLAHDGNNFPNNCETFPSDIRTIDPS